MLDRIESQILSLDRRNALERKPLSRDPALKAALRAVPGKWTEPMCAALGLPASTRDKERKAAILDYLVSKGSLNAVCSRLPEPSRQMISWLVLEQNGSSTTRELYRRFGPDADVSYHWNKGLLPTTPLGILRLHGLVFKGMTSRGGGREKIAAVPVELRPGLEEIARNPASVAPAPPMPAPACLNTTGLWDPLEYGARVWGGVNLDSAWYQFDVRLMDVAPPVWRRILVPGFYSFWDLHVAIQDSMGWLDYHLHEFRLKSPLDGREVILGIPGYDFDERITLPDYLVPVSDYFTESPVGYLYDFGDDWLHEITLEAVRKDIEGDNGPVCLDGGGACPPEDCGGPPGYEDFLRIIENPADEEHEETLTWAGGSFDPERFDPRAVHFDDPFLRWRVAFHDDESAYEVLLKQREAAEQAAGVAHPPVPAEPKITERERLIVESAVKAAGVRGGLVKIVDDAVVVYVADFDEEFVVRLQDRAGLMLLDASDDLSVDDILREPADPADILKDLQGYTPMMRFVVDDETERTFAVERMVFLQGVDWMFLDGPCPLELLANRFCPHIGKDSFYEL